MTHFAGTAVDQRIVEVHDVTACNPCAGIHKDCRIKPEVEFGLLNELLPPRALDVIFEFNTERTVIPRVCKSSVYFASGIHEASVFTESNYLVHRFF